MNPDTIKTLMESPQGRELMAYLEAKIVALNTLENLPGSDLAGKHDPLHYAVEGKARMRAVAILREVIEELVPPTSPLPKFDKKDYVS